MAVSTGKYRFGNDTGWLRLHTERTGLGRRAGHDLLLEATRWSGTAAIGADGQVPSGAVRVEVEVASLTVREGSGGLKPLTDHDREEIVHQLCSGKLLDAHRHPTVTFVSTGFTGGAEGFELTGDLTVAGSTENVTVSGAVGTDDRIRGSATVRQTRWGIKPYSAFLGALKLADDVAVSFDTALIPAG
ncbi:polyisoprenoid-binding protein [Actinocatenispora thailandica]|uniref:Polyisoprenoid-binding protein n=1 Tax=Actinocatenispora thailandica TaxID=227318 RepID=A0A7R7HWV0_9ACTN|nr:YceI family protein [Actinocatenispora thailandica]BCJ35467.1 polyisoprenoid-binding protein [Actinocatenispora thailandica]